ARLSVGNDGALSQARRQSVRQLLAVAVAAADLHGPVLRAPGEHSLPPGRLLVDGQPRGPGHADSLGRGYSVDQQTGGLRRPALPGAVLQSAAGAGGHADDLPAKDADASAGRRTAGDAAEDDEVHDDPLRIDFLQDAVGVVRLLHCQLAVGVCRTEVPAQEEADDRRRDGGLAACAGPWRLTSGRSAGAVAGDPAAAGCQRRTDGQSSETSPGEETPA